MSEKKPLFNNHLPSSERPTSVDAAIGERIRRQREKLGISQSRLAEEIRVTPRQLRKYEAAENRIAPERLLAVAAALGVDVMWLMTGSSRNMPQDHDETKTLRDVLIARFDGLESLAEKRRLVAYVLRYESSSCANADQADPHDAES